MGNIIGEGAVVAVIGLGTVFAVLIILWGRFRIYARDSSPQRKRRIPLRRLRPKLQRQLKSQ